MSEIDLIPESGDMNSGNQALFELEPMQISILDFVSITNKGKVYKLCNVDNRRESRGLLIYPVCGSLWRPKDIIIMAA